MESLLFLGVPKFKHILQSNNNVLKYWDIKKALIFHLSQMEN